MRDGRVIAALLCAHVGAAAAAAQSGTVSGWVNNGSTPVSEAAVYLMPMSGEPRTTPDEGAMIDQVHLRFVPTVLLVTPGTEVRFRNSDPVLHNVFGPGFDGDPFDLGTYEQDLGRSHVFTEVGVHVVLCHIHPEMAAYVIVAATPYKAVTAADGSFDIADVPAGRYRLSAWHKREWRSVWSFEVDVPERGLPELAVTLRRPRIEGNAR